MDDGVGSMGGSMGSDMGGSMGGSVGGGGGSGPVGSVVGSGVEGWMVNAVSALLVEMDNKQQEESEGERAARRLHAIRASEAERDRRLDELQQIAMEEEARRAVTRAAAAAAAEGERRRRLQIVKLEEDEERRVRQRHQQLAIEAMEAERERRISLQLVGDAPLVEEQLGVSCNESGAAGSDTLRPVPVSPQEDLESASAKG